MNFQFSTNVALAYNSPIDDIQNGLKRGIYRGLDTPPHYIAPPSKVEIVFIEPQTSLFSYSTAGDYRGTIQIVAENLACANTALVHFLDEEEMGKADPPMTAGLNQSGLANRMGIVNYFLNFAIKRDGLRVKRLVHRRRLAYR